jgi:DNA mismatch repair endonuclease MutH
LVRGHNLDSEEELLDSAKKLEGKRISQVSDLVGSLDERHRRHTKGVVAHVIETDYFGIEQNSSEEPDFKELGIELKVSPLRLVPSKGLINAKERNVVEMVDYAEVYKITDWRKNKHLVSKLSRVLFVFYLHERDLPALDWRVVSAFLWSPNREQDIAIQRDYDIIRGKVLRGEANREADNEFLATCPKHAGGFNREEPLKSEPGSLCPHPTMGVAQRRAFCIRNRPLARIVADALEVEIVKKGTTEGIPPSSFPCLGVGWKGG